MRTPPSAEIIHGHKPPLSDWDFFFSSITSVLSGTSIGVRTRQGARQRGLLKALWVPCCKDGRDVQPIAGSAPHYKS